MNPVIAGNWKMHLGREASLVLGRECAKLAETFSDIDVRIFPGFLALAEVAKAVANGKLAVGAQNCHSEDEGAYTGEVSPRQLLDARVQHVLLGHSERRHGFGEGYDLIRAKVARATELGLAVTLCVGETQTERDAGKAEQVVIGQLSALDHATIAPRGRIDIAYEPVWAIGTGRNATPAEAETVHALIRDELKRRKGFEATRILYGGSVKPGNCEELAGQAHIDGFLIGGASLNIADFSAIMGKAAAVFAKRRKKG